MGIAIISPIHHPGGSLLSLGWLLPLPNVLLRGSTMLPGWLDRLSWTRPEPILHRCSDHSCMRECPDPAAGPRPSRPASASRLADDKEPKGLKLKPDQCLPPSSTLFQLLSC